MSGGNYRVHNRHAFYTSYNDTPVKVIDAHDKNEGSFTQPRTVGNYWGREKQLWFTKQGAEAYDKLVLQERDNLNLPPTYEHDPRRIGNWMLFHFVDWAENKEQFGADPRAKRFIGDDD